MSALVVVSIACEPEHALAVDTAAATHPYVARHAYDEQLRRAYLVIDLPHLHAFADRECEREIATQWLEACRDSRPPRAITWREWCEKRGTRP